MAKERQKFRFNCIIGQQTPFALHARCSLISTVWIWLVSVSWRARHAMVVHLIFEIDRHCTHTHTNAHLSVSRHNSTMHHMWMNDNQIIAKIDPFRYKNHGNVYFSIRVNDLWAMPFQMVANSRRYLRKSYHLFGFGAVGCQPANYSTFSFFFFLLLLVVVVVAEASLSLSLSLFHFFSAFITFCFICDCCRRCRCHCRRCFCFAFLFDFCYCLVLYLFQVTFFGVCSFLCVTGARECELHTQFV